MTPEERLLRIERSLQQVIAEIENVPADVVYREPAAGEWPVMSTLAHVAEMLPYWAHQATAVARRPGEPFGRHLDDAARLGAISDHGQDSLQDMAPRIRAGLAECVALLRALPADAWTLAGQHPTRGSMTVEQLVDAFLVTHAQEHAEQIRATLETVAVTPPRPRRRARPPSPPRPL
jgi:uncharacterized damage-inducible protein DinB